MNGYIRKFLAVGLCIATSALCMPIQSAYAASAEVTAASELAMKSADGITMTADIVMASKKLTAPVLTAEAVGYNSADITWKAVKQAVTYELQQSADKKEYTTLVTLTSGQELRYHAQDMYTGTKTFFRVVATDASGATAKSKWLKVKPVLPAPTVTKMQASAYNQIDLAWTAVEGADFYRVYRSATEVGGYKSVKTVYGTSYTDTVATGVTYYYKIMPLRYNPDNAKVRGKCSTPQSIIAKMDAPKITSVTNTDNNSLTINWTAIDAADGYAVYRSTKKSSGYKRVKVLDNNTFNWTDTGVKAGTQYFYKVNAYQTTDGVNGYGKKSPAKSKWTVPDAPKDLKAIQDESGNVKLSWTKTAGATSYTIYRAHGDDDYVQIAIKVTENSYTDSGLVVGEAYSYRIQAVRGALVSDQSKAATVKLGVVKVNTRTLFLGPGVSKKVSAASEISGTVTWSSENPAVAKVDKNGKVTGVSNGKTTIYAEIGGVKASVQVTVTDCKVNGIDVSRWQQAIDWKTVKASGIQFAMLRLCYGTSVDIQFENYYAGATKNGIDVGVYCYTRATSVKEGIAEAKNLVKLLNGRALDYPVALDLEDEAQIKNMTKAQRTELIIEYKKIIEAAGYKFVVYSNLNWLTNYIDQSQLEKENVDIWIARYRSQSLGYGYEGGGNVTMWQYSSTGQVDGILDAYGRYINVDLDVCYGNY